MVTRKAILIGASGGAYNSKFLPGVRVDLQNMKEFLMSSKGGAWYDDEIIVLHNPTLETILYYRNISYADYNITYFSGHGFEDVLRKRFCQLTNGDYFEDKDLLSYSEKQLILIDACRTVISTGISGLGFGDPFEHFDGGEYQLSLARKMYDKWILNTKPGKVILHSTQSNTFSYDTRDGGLFTKTLIDFGKTVPVCNQVIYSSILNTGNKVLKHIHKDQKPRITYRRGNIELPFAMSLPQPKYTPRTQTKKVNDNTGLILALLLLGAVVAASKD